MRAHERCGLLWGVYRVLAYAPDPALTDENDPPPASFADPVCDGRSVCLPLPVTGLWALLYAQIHQADAAERRNILLGKRPLNAERDHDGFRRSSARGISAAIAVWTTPQIQAALAELTLGADTPLSCLAVETLPGNCP